MVRNNELLPPKDFLDLSFINNVENKCHSTCI